jgi:hypothetical protein
MNNSTIHAALGRIRADVLRDGQLGKHSAIALIDITAQCLQRLEALERHAKLEALMSGLKPIARSQLDRTGIV